MTDQQFFVTAALGLEPLLATELCSLGAVDVQEQRAGVSFSGSLETAYRVCLWSRLASRVLLPIHRFQAVDGDALYRAAAAVDWDTHLAASGTFVVDCALSHSRLTHSRYAALRVKDALVDQFRERCGRRPDVGKERPDLRLNLYVYRDQAVLSIDLSGDSLHRRGYRAAGRRAPLKENLAAAVLVRAGWPELSRESAALVDPMCGSGTLPVEAALMAADIAPGLLRDHFGFQGWKGHAPHLWDKECAHARDRRRQAAGNPLPVISGYDRDSRAIHAARDHATRAGVAELIHFARRDLMSSGLSVPAEQGLLVTNPPYGERLGDAQQLRPLYNRLGQMLAEQYPGWRAAVLTSDPQLGRSIGLRAERINTLYNGALKCRLLQFHLTADNHWKSLDDGAGGAVKKPLSAGAEMFANRLRKNLKKYRRWARREGVDCYRIYDADLPEYAVAIDLYGDAVHVQEYRAPRQVDSRQAALRLEEIMTALPQVLEVQPEKLHLKIRQQQKGRRQYRKFDQQGELCAVSEGNCRFWVNLTDYLDTGLFLDHRPTRRMIQEQAAGTRFLNLFGYTGTATVHALKGGARATTTVDMSRTYLQWTEKNLRLNNFDPDSQELIQADCLQWIAGMQQQRAATFDLIFLDPPTFSNSKGMCSTFDVQRDHADLILRTLTLLAPGGTLMFSNNLRSFKMDRQALAELAIVDISAETIPFDFARNPRIHNCWMIRKQP